jgi:hypothetical protein
MFLYPAEATDVPDWRNNLSVDGKVLETPVLPNSTILSGMLAVGCKTAEG